MTTATASKGVDGPRVEQARRPQVQELLTTQVVDALVSSLRPLGAIVVV